MIRYLWDTDILTVYQKGDRVVYQNVLNHMSIRLWPNVQSITDPIPIINPPIPEIGITVISVQEQLTGWYSQLKLSKKPDQLALVYFRLETAVRQLAWFPIASFTEKAILGYQQLLKMKLKVGKMDLCIAAIVLENNATLVTRDLRDFQRVPNLMIEDWSV